MTWGVCSEEESFDFETDLRIFRGASPNPCVRCSRRCTTIAHGLHTYICSGDCLLEAVQEFIVRRGLKDWAVADLSPRDENAK